MLRSFAILMSVSVLLICAGSGNAADLLVPSQYTTIADAISAAVDGDVVIVADGTYTGDGNRDIYFYGKAITVRSENGPAACIIDCQGTTRAFYLDHDEENAAIDGFTIINGSKTGGGVHGNGAAIYCRTGCATISNCIITNCTATTDIIRSQSGSGVIGNCVIVGNSGVGISCVAGSKTITNCVIADNNNFGIFASTSSVIVRNSIVRDNNFGDILLSDGSMNVSYSNIEGGYTGLGNVDVDPGFVAAGYWNDSGTPADETDDVWVMGDYHLAVTSNSIDAGDPAFSAEENATDIAGNSRVINGFVDLGAYEYGTDIGEEIVVTKMTIKAGRTRSDTAPTDSFDISAEFDATGIDFSSITTADIRIGPYEESLAIADFTQMGNRAIYNYRGSTGAINSARIDAVNGTVRIKAQNIDLTGLTAPVPVSVELGSHFGYGVAEDEDADDVINGTKNVPVQLLSGYADALVLSKARVTGNDTIATVTVQGYITVMDDSGSLVDNEMTIDIAAIALTIPAVDGFCQKGTTRNYSYKGAAPSDGSAYVATAAFNFDKCTFKLVIKNLDISAQTSPMDMRITFNPFSKLLQGIAY